MKASFYLAGVIAALTVPAAANAETILGLTNTNSIVSFDSATPNTITSTLAISGLGANISLVGIDSRPANGVLYGLGNNGTLYSLTNTGLAYQAVSAGSLQGTTLTGNSFGIDFNPTVDRLRIISDTGQNLRFTPGSSVTTIDGNINGPANISITGAGYTNSFAGATTTVLFGIDSGNGTLVNTTNPNGGVYTTVGSLGLGAPGPSQVGFDISGASGVAYLSALVGGVNNLYTVNLATGAATFRNTIGSGAVQITGLAVAGNVPEPATWGMMLLGFGMVGFAARRRRTAAFA